MQESILLKKLTTELEVNTMGDNRKFKFIYQHLGCIDLTIKFFIETLGYKPWQANKIKYNIIYRKTIYQNQKLNTSQ